MFDAPPTTTSWSPYGVRVVGDGGWIVAEDCAGQLPCPVARWTFGPEGVQSEGVWPEQASEILDAVKDSNFLSNFFFLDGEGTLVSLVPEMDDWPEEWVSVVRAPLGGEFETVVSVGDVVHGETAEEVREILGIVTGP